MPITRTEFNLHTHGQFKSVLETDEGRARVDAAIVIAATLDASFHLREGQETAHQAYLAAYFLEITKDPTGAGERGQLVSTAKGPLSASWAASQVQSGAFQTNRWGRLADALLDTSPSTLGIVG